MFYPENADVLRSDLRQYFDMAKPISFGTAQDKSGIDTGKIKALIVPHAGYVYSGQTAAWGYAQISNIKYKISNIKIKPDFILIGPTHNFYFEGIAGNDFTVWETPLGNVSHLAPVRDFRIMNDAFIPEHSVEVQLPFLQYLFKEFSVSCFLTGQDIDYGKTAESLIKNYPSSIFIFSSDMSHYLPQEEAEIKDKKTIDAILSGDITFTF